MISDEQVYRAEDFTRIFFDFYTHALWQTESGSKIEIDTLCNYIGKNRRFTLHTKRIDSVAFALFLIPRTSETQVQKLHQSSIAGLFYTLFIFDAIIKIINAIFKLLMQ